MVAGDQSDPADVLILGGGPGGYVAALRAAQLGRSVTVVERGRLGGVCLNQGCIPSKHLSRFAAAKSAAETFAASGMPPFSGRPDMALFQKSRAAAVDTLVKGVSSLLHGAGVKVVEGSARFVGRTRVCVEVGEESVRYFDFKDVVIATGSSAGGGDASRVEPSRALEWDSIPSTLLVTGDDYIALEIAVAYARLGSHVTLAVPGDRLLPDFDRDLSAAALRGARSTGVDVALSSGPTPGKWERAVASGDRRPNLDYLDLRAAGMAAPDGKLKVDAQLRLDRHVFAIGDVTAGLPLAHRAMAQGRTVGDVLGGKAAAFDSRAIPRAVFAAPELAAVGMTEEEALAAGISVSIGRFPLGALGRAVIESATAGFAKLVFAQDGGILLGAHLAGPRATELVAEMALAIEMGATSEDLALTVHAHPTFAEALMEAAEVSLGRPIHVRGAAKR
ncbi:MAG TPA: FAD-dependent oxidoreductase [Candidatus Dormibacteraeota bacterium]|nr:FAD-dependent oxidoreductase [Candidatus Dormibacteraeota bacterium]